MKLFLFNLGKIRLACYLDGFQNIFQMAPLPPVFCVSKVDAVGPPHARAHTAGAAATPQVPGRGPRYPSPYLLHGFLGYANRKWNKMCERLSTVCYC